MSTSICIHIMDKTDTPSEYVCEVSDHDKYNVFLREFLEHACRSVGCDQNKYCLIHHNNVVGVCATLATTLAHEEENCVSHSLVEFSAIRLLQPTPCIEELYNNNAMSLQSVKDIEIVYTGIIHECNYVLEFQNGRHILDAIAAIVIQLEQQTGRDIYASQTSLERMTNLTGMLTPLFLDVPARAWASICKM
jgi:hypothetical protein